MYSVTLSSFDAGGKMRGICSVPFGISSAKITLDVDVITEIMRW